MVWYEGGGGGGGDIYQLGDSSINCGLICPMLVLCEIRSEM